MTDVTHNWIVFHRLATNRDLNEKLESTVVTATDVEGAIERAALWETDPHLHIWWAIPLDEWNQSRRNVRRSINLEVIV